MKFRFLLGVAVAAVFGSLLAVQAQVPGVNSTLNSVFTLAYDNSTMKPTYSASAVITTATVAQDVCSLSGSATKNIRVRRIILSGNASAVQSVALNIVKRSTAYSGGTSSAPAIVSYDSRNSAATAVFTAYTANPTPGTLVGAIAEPHLSWNNTTTGTAAGPVPLEIKFGELASPVVLVGAAQFVAVNLGGTTFTSGALSCTMEWTEE